MHIRSCFGFLNVNLYILSLYLLEMNFQRPGFIRVFSHPLITCISWGYLLLLFCLPSSFVALAQWRTSSNFLWCPEAQRLSLHSLCQKWYFQPHHRQKVQGFHQRLEDRWSAQGNFPRELVRPSRETPYQCSSNLLFGTSLLDQADQKEKNKKQTVVSRLKFATVFVLL